MANEEMQPVVHEPVPDADDGQVPPIDLSWDSLSYQVQLPDKSWKTLVHPQSGTARAGRVVALMGPSGAGKTTLMNSISGRVALGAKTNLDGTAYLNDTILRTKYKPLISFVAQDDIIMGLDTPREALYFSHRTRYGASHEEAEKAVDRTLEKLRMTKCADTLVGVPGLVKGVSGGEKKRANIGSELINSPQILFLDEPTTGLDSVTALRVGELLKELAHEHGKTIVCTIHTPSSHLFECFDDVLLLAKGHVIYHGPRDEAMDHFAAAGHPVPELTNPCEHYLEVLQLPEDDVQGLAGKWASSPGATAVLPPAASKVTLADEGFSEELEAQEGVAPANVALQVVLLLQREWRNTYRDPMATFGRVIQEVIYGLMYGLLFLRLGDGDSGVQDRRGFFFTLTVNSMFIVAYTYVIAFPRDRAVFFAEMANDAYNPVAYYTAKVVADLPMLVGLPVLSTTVVYWMTGMAEEAGAFFAFVLTMAIFAQTSAAIGLLIAALAPTIEVGMEMVTVVLMPLILVGGAVANTDRLEPAWNWLTYVAYPRNAYKAMMDIEFREYDPAGRQYATGMDVLRFEEFTKGYDRWYWQVLVMLAMALVLRVAGAVALYVLAYIRRTPLVFSDNFKARRKQGNEPTH